jgi:predicted XRE-type DNA-binding protein
MKERNQKPTKVTPTPPKGWPSDKILKAAEKRLKNELASRALPANASPAEKVKQELCTHFIRYKQKEAITQRELAQRLGVTENRVSEILHYHHKQFTIDRLLGLLTKIRRNATLKVA